MMEGKDIITITLDSYTGVYSGGKYVAWNLYPWQIPNTIATVDSECEKFWSDIQSFPVPICYGKGETPEEAMADLEDARDIIKQEGMLERWDHLVGREMWWDNIYNKWWIDNLKHDEAALKNKKFEISGSDFTQYLKYKETGLTPEEVWVLKTR